MIRTLLHLSISLDIGGLENLILNLCQRIDRRRYRPIVCCLSDGLGLQREFEELGIPAFSIPKREGFDWCLIPSIVSLLRRERVDILHTHNACPYLYGTIAGTWAGVRTLVHTEHSNIEREHGGLWRAEKYLSYLAYPIIADSKNVADTLVHEQSVHPRRVRVILNGIDVQRFRPSPPNRQLQQELGIRETDRVIGIVARLVPVKNHEVLFSSFAMLCSMRPNLRLLVVGDGPLRRELEKRAQALGISNRVVFAGNQRDIPGYLSLMDVFVLSSISEGLPLTLLEAMAAGIPVVCTRVGGIPEVIRHGVNGLLAASDAHEELGERCLQLLDDPLFARSLAKKAREEVIRKYSLRAMTRAYEAVYNHMGNALS